MLAEITPLFFIQNDQPLKIWILLGITKVMSIQYVAHVLKESWQKKTVYSEACAVLKYYKQSATKEA